MTDTAFHNIHKSSLQRRYLSKFRANFINAGVSVIILIIALRSLGPSAYGNFNFLTEFFISVLAFLNMGTSIGFFTKLSKRQVEVKLIRFYLGFLCLIFIGIVIFISTVFLFKQEYRLWPDQQTVFILFAAVFAFLMLLVRVLRQTNDALGFTIKSENYLIIQKILSLVIVVILFLTNMFNLVTFFLHYFVVFSFILFLWFMSLNQLGIKPFTRANATTRLEKKNYFREFYHYSHPLFVYSLVGLIASIGGRWLLQTFGGSEQQGFFSLAYKLGALILLFSGSFTPLFTREFSIYWKNQDFERMRFLYKKFVPLFYSIAACLGVFVAFNATRIGTLLGGSEYQKAGLALAIMSFYPLHQVYGQLNGGVFYATDQTKLYRNIGVVAKITSIFVAYLFIAPNKYGGLSLGAVGIALSTVIVQFVFVNVQLLFHTRFLDLSFIKFFSHQLIVIGLFSLLAYSSNWFSGQLFFTDLIQLIISTVVYFTLFSILVLMVPQIISSTRSEIINNSRKLIDIVFRGI